MRKIPQTGLKGLKENWQSDVLAALSVSFVALPLALGIALASGVPPMAGIIAVVVGGVVTTFFRGSHLAINGPAAGLIAIIVSSLAAWGDDPQRLNYVLAAIVVSGLIQVVLGFLKLGKFAEFIHSSVINGIMAAIGIIIFAQQIHVAFIGKKSTAEKPIAQLADFITHLDKINPWVAIISISGLLIMIFQYRIGYNLFKFIPAPMWVLLISVPFAIAFGFGNQDSSVMNLFGKFAGDNLLVNIPTKIEELLIFPDFSMIGTSTFWTSVTGITMIASIQSLAMGKAVDKIDPYRRKTNFDKDLVAVGLSSAVSGMLGGLPIITVIVRSTVNVQNNAKTKWSNLYHGIFMTILVMAIVLPPAPYKLPIPYAALAVILVFTGYKLASPKVFKQVLDQGIEQFIFFAGTLFITLYNGLLAGIFGGLLITAITHLLLARVPTQRFIQMVFNSGSLLVPKDGGGYELKIKGIANFLGAIKMNNLLSTIPKSADITIDFSEARLVDLSTLEKVYEFQKLHSENGGKVDIQGLENHISSTNHKMGLKLLTTSTHRMTKREKNIKEIAEQLNWNYETEPIGQTEDYLPFYFFKSRAIEFKRNCIRNEQGGIWLEIADLTFEEGAYMAYREYTSTLGLIKLPFKIPKFTIERKEFLDKYLDFSAHKDIDYISYYGFSEDFTVKVEDKKDADEFFTPVFLEFLHKSNISHIESSGEAVVIFPTNFRPAHIHEYANIIHLMKEMEAIIKKSS